MAASRSLLSEPANNLDFTVENIELEVKKRMQWSVFEWQSHGEVGTRIHKLVNSMRYWYTKLNSIIGDKCFVITLFNAKSDARMELMEIINAVSELGEEIEMTGFSDFRNPKYIAIHFKTSEMKILTEKKFKMMANNLVISLEWAAKPAIHQFRIHWLPMEHELTSLKKMLNKYIEILDIQNEKIITMSGKSYDLSLLIVRGILKEGITLEMLPHLINIDTFEILITVFGREPMCLTCGKLGHLSIKCNTPFCKMCKMLHSNAETCNVEANSTITYAQKVKQRGRQKPYQTNLEEKINSNILEQSNVDPEEDSIKDINQDAVQKISEYFGQLQNLKLPSLGEAKKLLDDNVELKIDKTNIDVSNKMELGSINLKRKSREKADLVTEELEYKTNRKTYGRNTSKTIQRVNTSNNLFDVLLERGEEDSSD